MPRRFNLPALALTLLVSGSVALGARCLSPGVARCSWETLTGHGPTLDVPYLGTRPEVIDKMLDMAAVGPGDRVLDLGTGDGRILIAAARRGASGTGIDIDPVLIGEAKAAAIRAGVADRTRFMAQDLFVTPVRGHSVVTMFLLPQVNLRLRSRLLRDLAPGSRIVSHAFDMADWAPDSTGRVGGSHLYLWRVPAAVRGKPHDCLRHRLRCKRTWGQREPCASIVTGVIDAGRIDEGRADVAYVNVRALRYLTAQGRAEPAQPELTRRVGRSVRRGDKTARRNHVHPGAVILR